MNSNQETIRKIRFILSQKESEELAEDKILKIQIKLLFGIKDAQDEINFPPNANNHQILAIFVELVNVIFEMKKSERKLLYKVDLYNIKDKNIISLIQKLRELETFEIEFNNESLLELFALLSNALDAKENWSLPEYLDSVLINISFLPQFKSLLKFEIYSMIIKYYLGQCNVLLNFHEEEMNVEEEKSLKLIIALFQKTKVNDELLVLSIIILNYNSLTENMKPVSIEKILSIIKDISFKIQNIKKSFLCVDKILMMFSEEIQMQNIKKIKKRKNKNKTGSNTISNSEIQEKQQVGELSGVKEKNEILLNNVDTKENKINMTPPQKDTIDLSCVKNVDNTDKSIIAKFGDNYDDKKNIINLFNKIFNNTNMGNDSLNEDVKKLQNIMLNLVDENKKMKSDLNELREEVINLKLKGDNLKTKGDNLRARVDYLERDCDDMKYMLGLIQCRNFSKNFLSYFEQYLTKEDYSDIKDKKISKCDAIIKEISKKYKDADKKKLFIVINLIKKSSELVKDGNFFAHSLTLENYEEEIEEYKSKNNLDKLPSPNKFCFLVSIGMYNDHFHESFSFLCRFFGRNLKPKGNYDLLNEYFK